MFDIRKSELRAAKTEIWEIYKHFQNRSTSDAGLHPLKKVLAWKDALDKVTDAQHVGACRYFGRSETIDEVLGAKKDLDGKISEIAAAAPGNMEEYLLPSDPSVPLDKDAGLRLARIIAWVNHFDD